MCVITILTYIYIIEICVAQYHSFSVKNTKSEPSYLKLNSEPSRSTNLNKRASKRKSILIWPGPYTDLAYILQNDNTETINRFCSVTNCFIHKTKRPKTELLHKYDAILFHQSFDPATLNAPRSARQKYIFSFEEPPHRRLLAKHSLSQYNSYFNWTMSYRMTSDIVYSYFSVIDINSGIQVAPNRHVHWIKRMNPISNLLKKKLRSKTKLGAIFMSQCKGISGRFELVAKMNDHLRKDGRNLSIDIFGACGRSQECVKGVSTCDEMLENNYYFYLAFENSFYADYVTEKVLRAVRTFTVPVVYGGADYSRFLPHGSYINACSYDPVELANLLLSVISNWTLYYDYFRFRNHYLYLHTAIRLPYLCDLCEMLNNNTVMEAYSSYDNFVQWYYSDNSMKCNR